MNQPINTIVSNNKKLLNQKEISIFFGKDHEGKRLINNEIAKLYNKKIVLSNQDFTEIIIVCYVAIKKMIGMKQCSWTYSELMSKLENGMRYYQERVNIGARSKPENSDNSYSDFLHNKYPPKIKTKDGHLVRSKSEKIIDDFLFDKGIVHAYEKKLPVQENIYSDFYIPIGKNQPLDIYIEFWGLENNQKYLERKNFKIGIYNKHKFNLIELVEKDIEDLEEVLTQKLLRYRIQIH
ncbi:MAG: hypothetical protein QM706_03295 [Nitrospira sp.]